jgi:hypothetical protein
VYTKVTAANKVFFLSWLGLVLLHYNKEKIKQLTPTKDKRKFKERGKNFFQA